MVPTIIGFIDSRLKGQKTYILMGLGMGMMVCQMMGYHSFSEEAWGMLGIGGAATWKMGIDRDKK
jgi:hypothetical protein